MMGKTWHQHVMRVHYKETDQMGVVHHGNYVSWFEIGRTEMMRDAGIAYSDMEDLGLLLPVLDLEVKYHKPARYDDCVAIYTKLTDYTPVRLQFEYEVRRVHKDACLVNDPQNVNDENNKTGDMIASGHTLHMWLNNEWKPARLDKVAPDVYKLLDDIANE